MNDCKCRENNPVCLLGTLHVRIIKFYARRIKQADFPGLPPVARDSWLTSYNKATEKYTRHIQGNRPYENAS